MSENDLLKNLLDKLDTKVDKLDQKLDSIDNKVVENTVILEEHQRRSLANEQTVELLRKELKPVQQHVVIVNGILKFIGFIALAVGLVESILGLLKF